MFSDENGMEVILIKVLRSLLVQYGSSLGFKGSANF